MLVLTRKLGEAIVVDGNIRIVLVQVNGKQVRIGIEAPKNISIQREELQLVQSSEEAELKTGTE